jgi:hypothetical protein
MVKSGNMSASVIYAVHLPSSAMLKKKDGRLADFGMYARYFRSLRGRLTGMEDDDASKFVTHWKGTKNKKTTSNKDDSSALIDDGLSESDDNEGPFGLP